MGVEPHTVLDSGSNYWSMLPITTRWRNSLALTDLKSLSAEYVE